MALSKHLKATLLIAFLTVIFFPSTASAWTSNDGAVSIHAPSTSAGAVPEVVVDSSGNIYACGWYRGEFDVDPDPDTTVLIDGAGQNQPVISKYNTSGNLIWARLLDADISGVVGDCAVSNDGAYVAVTGHYKGTMDFDGAGSMATITSASEWDAFVVLINASTGDVVWGKGAGGETIVEGRGVDFGPGNEVYVAATFLDTSDTNFDAGTTTSVTSVGGSYDWFINKISVSGSVEWAHTIGDVNADFVYDVAVDRDNHHVYVGGFISPNARDYDPDPSDEVLLTTTGTGDSPKQGGYDSWIAQFDATGDLGWAKSFGSSGNDRIDALAAKGGFVYATGWQSGAEGDWDTGSGTIQLGSTTRDLFAMKMNSSGQTQWAVAWGGSGTSTNGGTAIAVDSSGNVYSAGHFNGTADLDSGAGTNNYTTDAGIDTG